MEDTSKLTTLAMLSLNPVLLSFCLLTGGRPLPVVSLLPLPLDVPSLSPLISPRPTVPPASPGTSGPPWRPPTLGQLLRACRVDVRLLEEVTAGSRPLMWRSDPPRLTVIHLWHAKHQAPGGSRTSSCPLNPRLPPSAFLCHILAAVRTELSRCATCSRADGAWT